MVDDNLAIDLPLAIPFQHDIGRGRAGRRGQDRRRKGPARDVAGPIPLHGTQSQRAPVCGLGLTYAAFYGARTNSTMTAISGGTPSNPTTMTVDSKRAATAARRQLPARRGWFIDACYTYTPLSTTAKLSTGQTLDTKLDPSSVSLAVGMRF